MFFRFGLSGGRPAEMYWYTKSPVNCRGTILYVKGCASRRRCQHANMLPLCGWSQPLPCFDTSFDSSRLSCSGSACHYHTHHLPCDCPAPASDISYKLLPGIQMICIAIYTLILCSCQNQICLVVSTSLPQASSLGPDSRLRGRKGAGGWEGGAGKKTAGRQQAEL